MRNLKVNATRIFSYAAMLAVVLSALVAAPLLSSAHAPTASISITNNSSRNILHIYLADPARENWGPDQLNEAVMGTGQTVTLSNVSCPGAEVRIIGEDTDGCFVSTVVACTSNASWTITDEATPNCGN
jgi:hypothetical protein